MLQGVGARFDFHMCKTLCDLRWELALFMNQANFPPKDRGNFRYYC